MGFGSVVGSVAGGVISGGLNAWSAHEAREADQSMYRHRYRTMVADLKAAGLNPMLAYMKDAGTPPTTSAARFDDLGDNVAAGIQAGAHERTSSAQSALLKAQTEKVDQEKELLKAQTDELRSKIPLHGAHTAESQARVPLVGAQVEQATASAGESRARTAVQEAELGRIAADVKRIGSQTDLNQMLTRATKWDAETKEYMLPFVLSLASSDAQRRIYGLPEAKNKSAREDMFWRLFLEKVYGIVRGVDEAFKSKFNDKE